MHRFSSSLPHYSTQDIILSREEALLSQALAFASTPNYTQENRADYTSLDSFLSSSSFQDYLKAHRDKDPKYSIALQAQELNNTYEQDKLKEQEREARESLQTLLEQRLQAVKKDKESLDPNEFSSLGVSAEDLKIEAGQIINTSLIEAGYTTLIGDVVINENGTIVSREDLNIEAKDFKNLGADLLAGKDLKIKADRVEIGTRETYTDYLGGSQHTVSNIKGGNNITISSNTDAKFTSVNMEANNNLSINAKGDVVFDTITKSEESTQSHRNFWWSSYSKTNSTLQVSNALKGNNVSITSGKNLTAYNLGIQAKGNVALKANGDITLSTKADTHHTERFFTGKKEDKSDLTDYNVQAINGNNISISAGKNAHLSSVDIGAKDNLSIRATENVLLDTLVKKQVDTTKTESTKLGWFKVTKTTTTTTATTKTNISNSLKGNNISISTGKDLTGFNLKAEAKEKLALSAGNDLILSTKADEKKVEEHKVEKSFGFQGHKEDNPIRKNVGVSLGYTEITTDTNITQKTHNNQTLSANKISLTSGNQTKLESINTDSKELSITGKEVSITALSDELDQTINKKEEFWGIGASLGVNTYVPAIEAGIGFANTETTSTDTLYQTSTSSANLKADKISITTSNKQGNPRGDINIIGSNLNGGEIALTGKNVKIEAHKTEHRETHTSTTKTKFQVGVYGGVGIGGINLGLDLYDPARIGLAFASIFTDIPMEVVRKLPPSKLNTNHKESNSTSHTGSKLVGNNIAITSEKNTNIIGSSINATGETKITGKNVNVIASIDTKTEFNAKIKNDIKLGVGVSTNILDLRLDTDFQGNIGGSASTKVNNASIQSDKLSITTTQAKVDTTQAAKNHKAIGDRAKKLFNNIKNYVEAKKEGNGYKQGVALAGMTINAPLLIKDLKNSLALDTKNLNAFLGNTLFGNVNILGGNLKANNVKMDVKGDLNIGSIQSHSASGRVDLEAKTASLGAAYLAQLANIDANIQGNANATIKEQAGIKAEKVNITTNRNTSLSNAYISAADESSSIKSNTMTKLDFKDVSVDVKQSVGASANLVIDKWVDALDGGDFETIKNDLDGGQTLPAIKKISELINLYVAGSGSIAGSITSRPSSISQSIKVEVGKDKKEPKNIYRGEPQEVIKTEVIKPLYNLNGKFWTKK